MTDIEYLEKYYNGDINIAKKDLKVENQFNILLVM